MLTDIFPAFHKKITFWTKLRLLFVRSIKYRVGGWTTVYKMMDGKVYVTGFFDLRQSDCILPSHMSQIMQDKFAKTMMSDIINSIYRKTGSFTDDPKKEST